GCWFNLVRETVALKLQFTLLMALVGLVGLVVATGESLANGRVIRLDDPAHVSHLRLTIDQSETFRADAPIAEALIANASIADVVPLTDHTIYLVGKEIGLTRLTLLDADKKLLGVVEIEVTYDIEGLRQELERSVPSGDFKIRTANGRILLGGSVGSALSVARAVEITEQFTANCRSGSSSGRSGGQAKRVRADQPSQQGQLAGGQQQAGGNKGQNNGQNGSPRCFSNVMTVRAAQQVMLEVRFVEALRTAARDLGLAWDAKTGRFKGMTGIAVTAAALPSGVLPLTAAFPSGAIPFGNFITTLLDNGNTVDSIIDALETKGLARRLAEPNLVTLSGNTANFLAGGEFPFPIQADNFQTTIEFKKFGVGLAFTPTVLDNGQINLEIEPEVSDLDMSSGLTINGTTIPSLIVRRASTTVELRDGQSFAIAGLIQTRHRKALNQLPWLGDVPVLGPLFRSSSYEKEESDLVIIVTPRLVRPAVPGQRLITPLDQKLASNDRDFFLRGKLEVGKHWDSPYGHIIDPYDGWDAEVDYHASYK
ncbi:MAG: type II and III secretion system protein family protein, partial [Hyphomicrobium sp.]